MAKNEKPTFEQISLYYDGLLSGEEKKRVEEFLQSSDECNDIMNVLESFDSALQPNLSEADINNALSNTIQEIHARIEEPRVRQNIGWGRLLSPKFIFSAVVIMLLFTVSFSLLQNDVEQPQQETPQIAQNNETTEPAPAPVQEPLITSNQENKNEDSSQEQNITEEMQAHALIAMAQYAKKAMNAGMQIADKNRNSIPEPLVKGAEQTLALGTLKKALMPSTDDQTSKDEDAMAQSITKMSKQQIALGLGASVISLITVF